MEPFLGQIELLPFTFAPEGWATCEGQLLSIRKTRPCFLLLAPILAATARRTSPCPTCAAKSPHQNTHYCIALEGIYPSRP